MKEKAIKLTVKDLVLIGILTTLLTVVGMAVGVLTMPFMGFALIAGAPLTGLVTAPIYLLLAFKVGKRGVMLLHSVLRGLFYTLMGLPHLFIIMLPLGIIGELIMIPASSYQSIKRNTVAWSVFNAGNGLLGPILLWIFGGQYFSEHFSNMFSAEQLVLMNLYYFDPLILLAIAALGAGCGALGCLLGWSMLKRHFIKSGLIQGSEIVEAK
jgi:multidrug/hemolysin transport system ATP-binding protein/energy-coupling factor transport system substrate-specific component